MLPALRIGSTAIEMTGPNVILRPHQRKRNQCIMNLQQSISIVGKHHPENLRGEVCCTASYRSKAIEICSKLSERIGDRPAAGDRVGRSLEIAGAQLRL